MQQDEHALSRRFRMLPEEPDEDAAIEAIALRIADGGGQEKLPPDLFAGLQRRRNETDVVVLHPTADGGRPSTSTSGGWRLWLVAMTAAAAATVVASVALRDAPTRAEPTALATPPPESSTPPDPRPPPNPQVEADHRREEIAVAEAVVALEALHDEDPSARPKRVHRKRARSSGYRRARKVWRHGRLAYEDGQLDRARAKFLECLAHDGAHSPCLNSLGRLAAEEHDPARARDLFQRAIDADAANPYPMVNLATLAVLERKLDEAEGLLRQATEVAPDLKPAQRLQGRLAYLRERLRDTKAAPSR